MIASILEWCRYYGGKTGGPVLLGLTALYVPTFYDLAQGIWGTEDQAHGPFILAVTLYLFWQKRQLFMAATENTNPWAGSLILLLGLLFYVVGRSQDILLFEIGSLIWVLTGTLFIFKGLGVVRQALFPLLFIVFLIPLPRFLVDALTGPLKQAISLMAEQLLYWAGYPIARVGVSLHIGQYQLMVADACSGLHSLFSLLAVGVLYQHLVAYKNWKHRILLFLSIIPVAFFSNVVRVILLVLITYHLGDEAGQGFLHGAAGIVMFTVAILVFFILDSLLGKVFPEQVFVPSGRTAKVTYTLTKGSPQTQADVLFAYASKPMTYTSILLACLMIVASIFATIAKPTHLMAELYPRKPLVEELPSDFKRWKKVETNIAVVADPTQQAVLTYLYTETLNANYVNNSGQLIMLSLAYGKNQRDEHSVHNPSRCYPAQGFTIIEKNEMPVALDEHRSIIVRYMKTQRGQRIEPLIYWVTGGDTVYQGDNLQQKLILFKYSKDNLIPDGLILRVSTLEADSTVAMSTIIDFVNDWYQAMPEQQRSRYFGGTNP